MLNSYVSESDNGKWDQYLPLVVTALNNSVHEETQRTPFEVVFVQPSKFPLEKKNYHEFKTNYNEEISKEAEKIRKNVRDNLQSQQQYRLHNYLINHRTTARQFQVGQKVKIAADVKHNKFSKAWSGPYTITDVTTRNITVKTDKGFKTIVKDKAEPWVEEINQ